jgi:hypothetical protein
MQYAMLPDDDVRIDHNVICRNNAMLRAIVNGDVPLLLRCLMEGAEPNVPILEGEAIRSTNFGATNGATPLMLACICAPEEKYGVPVGSEYTCVNVLLEHAEVDIYAKWEPPDYPGMDSITAMGIAYGATKFRPRTGYLRTALVDRAVYLAVVAEFQIDKIETEAHLLYGNDPAPQARALNLSIQNNAMLQAIVSLDVRALRRCLRGGADPNLSIQLYKDSSAAPALIVAFIHVRIRDVPVECEEVTVAHILLRNVRLNLYAEWNPPPGMYYGEPVPITAMVLAVGGRKRLFRSPEKIPESWYEQTVSDDNGDISPLPLLPTFHNGMDHQLVGALLRSGVHYAGATDSAGAIESEITDALENGKLQDKIRSTVLSILLRELLPQAFKKTTISYMLTEPSRPLLPQAFRRPRTNRFKV